jgi:5-methylcytosine-specific restriction protein A
MWAERVGGLQLAREADDEEDDSLDIDEEDLRDEEDEFEPLPEQVAEDEEYVEGAIREVTVNAYERSAAARQACIDHWGTECCVCGFNFGEAYGDLGEGYIHVHHLVSLAEIGEEYEVNPVKDLRPICPNCHAMIHSQDPPLTVKKLRQIVQRNRA